MNGRKGEMNHMLVRIREKDLRVSEWSGGVTRQFAIFPDGADYGARDFLWRVSSAGVFQDESDFTALPDYKRCISVIDGEMLLEHGDGSSVRLTPGIVYCFDGGAPTHSYGTCTDFNLMLRKGQCEGGLSFLSLEKGEQRDLPMAQENRGLNPRVILYCIRGAGWIRSGSDEEPFAAGDAFAARGGESIQIGCRERAAFMAAEAYETDSLKETPAR